LHPRGVAALHSTLEQVDGRPSVHDPDTPPELDAICVRATKLDRSDRYATARALGEAVQGFLDGDRDVALRKQLAETELAVARAAVAAGDRPIERQTAMRAAARALALDPTSREPADLVGRLMLEPTREVPSEVAETMTQSEDYAIRNARIHFQRGAVFALVGAPGTWLAGLPLWCVMVFFIAPLAAAIANYVVPQRHEKSMWYFGWFAWLTVVATLSVATTPFLMVPGMIAIIAVLAAMTFRAQMVIALILAAALVPWFFTLVGLLPHNVAIAGHTIVLSAASDQIDPVFTLIGLVVNLVLTTAFAVAFVQSIVNDRRDMQTKLAVQAWQLGQLISADE
jgi:serine/threonine-protein kinase